MNRGVSSIPTLNLLWELPNGALLHSQSRRLSLALFSLSAVVPAAALAVALLVFLLLAVGAPAALTVALLVFLLLPVVAPAALTVALLVFLLLPVVAPAALTVFGLSPVVFMRTALPGTVRFGAARVALSAPPMRTLLIAMPRSVFVTV